MRRFVLTLTAFFVMTTPAHATWVWPVSGEVITPYRNGTDPYATGQHRGIDIGAPVGTPVVAAAGGDVRFAGTAGSSGVTISIRTGDGYDTSYLHLSSLSVRAGAHVSAGERIGAVGTTGVRSAPAPHLHFGVRDAGTRHDYHDPLAFLPPPTAAPEPPVATPVPAPAPAAHPAPPAGAPVTAPRAAPAPVPALRRGPRLHPAPHRRATPLPRAAPQPRAVPERAPAPNSLTAPAPRTALHTPSVPAGQSARHPAAVHTQRPRNPAPRTAPVSRSPRRAAHAEANQQVAGQADGSDNGLDVGWIAACGGLLLVAALLGVSGDRARSLRHPDKPGLVTIAGRPSADLTRARAASILRQAGPE
jgi:hypothetical protein